jgi:hypothetical protein
MAAHCSACCAPATMMDRPANMEELAQYMRGWRGYFGAQAGRIGGLPGGHDEAVDVADGEDLRQWPAALGPFQDGGGVVAAMAFGTDSRRATDAGLKPRAARSPR